MAYIKPKDVISPKAHWHLFDVVLDKGADAGAYALGTWDEDRRIGFRWNGGPTTSPLGNPQSRGLPTWTMLDPDLHEAVIELLSPEKQILAKRFLGVRSLSEHRATMAEIRKFHEDQVSKIKDGTSSVAMLDGGALVVHVVPFSAIDGQRLPATNEVFRHPEKFPPIRDRRHRDSKVDYDGLVTGSNGDGLGKPQRAYVRVFRSGAVEAVASSIIRGRDHDIVELPVIQAMLVAYARHYAAALNGFGISPPFAVLASLINLNGKRLIQSFVSDGFPEDQPHGVLSSDALSFGDAIFEVVPADENESAKVLSPILNHLANAAGLASSPYFGPDGNWELKVASGL